MNSYVENIQIPDYIRKIKIDIGLSYAAPQSNVWLKHDADLFVFGFEPNPECIETLTKKNIQKRHPAHGEPVSDEFLEHRMAIIPVALGNVAEKNEMDFYMMSNDCGTSSLYQPTDGNLGPIKQIVKVPVFSLKHFFDSFQWWDRFPYIEYIKIDAQGSDLDILKGAGDYLRERVVFVTAEPEYYSYSGCGHNNQHEIDSYMNSQGFYRVHGKQTSDPTFINKNYDHLKDDIFVYQQG